MPGTQHAVQGEPKRQRQDSDGPRSCNATTPSLHQRGDAHPVPKEQSAPPSPPTNRSAQPEDPAYNPLKDRGSQLVAEGCAAYISEHGTEGLLPFPLLEVSEAIAQRAGVKNTQVERFVVRRLRNERTPGHLYLMLHKPAGCSSMRTPGATVYALLAKLGYPPLPHVGRLDKQTEGLLLFTDDGALSHALADGSAKEGVGEPAGLAHHLILNSAAVEGLCSPLEYEPGKFTSAAQDLEVVGTELKAVRPSSHPLEPPPAEAPPALDAKAGSGPKIAPGQDELQSAPGEEPQAEKCDAKPAVSTPRERRHALLWVQLSISQGKKHQVRKLFGRAGMRVKRLVRVAFGGLQLGELGLGKARSLTSEEVAQCYHATGLATPPGVLLFDPKYITS